MKMRVFQMMDDAVFRVTINTEDWSEGDLDLMAQFGEPEVNVGGDIHYVNPAANENTPAAKGVDVPSVDTEVLLGGDLFVRVMHGFPYSRGFDSRDFSSVAEARVVGSAWKEMVLRRITDAVMALRNNIAQLPTEEILQI